MVANYQMAGPPASWEYRIYFPGILSLHLPLHTDCLKEKKDNFKFFSVADILLVSSNQLFSLCSEGENLKRYSGLYPWRFVYISYVLVVDINYMNLFSTVKSSKPWKKNLKNHEKKRLRKHFHRLSPVQEHHHNVIYFTGKKKKAISFSLSQGISFN